MGLGVLQTSTMCMLGRGREAMFTYKHRNGTTIRRAGLNYDNTDYRTR